MKKIEFSLVYLLCILLMLTGCSSSSTADNAKPEKLYEANNQIDMIVIEDTAYVSASNVDWVIELSLSADSLLGKIEETNVSNNFSDWDATVLDIGTLIYSTERSDVVLVVIGESLVPYLKYMEG